MLEQAVDELGAYQHCVRALSGDTDLAVEDQVPFRGVVALEGGGRPAGAVPLARRAAAAAPRLWGRVPRPVPLTASAIQTATATTIVLPLSYTLDPQRYYWGVIGVVVIGAGVVPDRAGRGPPGAALGSSPACDRAARPPVRGRPPSAHYRRARTAIARPPRSRRNGHAGAGESS